jgi:hypothetical protein
MLRWLATAAIALLLALDVYMPWSDLGRRGTERAVRAHVPAVARLLGQPLPDLAFEDAHGRAVRAPDLVEGPLLLVFERSADW